MKKNRQTSLFLPAPDPPKPGSRNWMLLFKASKSIPPICVIGTLDYVYEELKSALDQYPIFWFADIYRPDGRLHRRYGKKVVPEL